MYISEELTKQENKKAFRELVMKYHPDRGGDEIIMKRITSAADKGDSAFENFRDELLANDKDYDWRKDMEDDPYEKYEKASYKDYKENK